jgi:hypothetical protein
LLITGPLPRITPLNNFLAPWPVGQPQFDQAQVAAFQ